MEEKKINHWKKNIDANFISGEDLHDSVRGLRPEMIVTFSREQDREAYDQNQNKKKVVTGVYLKDLNGNELAKPVVMNKKNGSFLAKEFGTPDMDLWPKDKPVILYAQPDARFGWVARFKKYSKPEMKIGDTNFVNCRRAYLADPKNLELIKTKYFVSAEVETALTAKAEEAK